MTSSYKYQTLLFDLDGTMTDSSAPVMAALRVTFKEFGVADHTDAELQKYIGPPLTESFREFAQISEDDLPAALEHYRQQYQAVMLEGTAFPGIIEMLKSAHEAGIHTAMATSKSEPYAQEIADHLGFSPYLDVQVGASEERADKSAVIAHALKLLQDKFGELGQCAIIGDRIHDFEGAVNNQIDSIGAAWGFGPQDELAQATMVLATPPELLALITVE
ncbi:HAD hydrolase-like protein [Boudabousia tangfeifanii]|nr:HAD hydrolase-like protein [Boudabousia tangfeifanii]